MDAIDQSGGVFNYYLQNGELLFQYYDIQDRIHRGADNVVLVGDRARPGSVFEALENASKDDLENQAVHTREHGGDTLRRDQLLDIYLQRMDPNYNRVMIVPLSAMPVEKI